MNWTNPGPGGFYDDLGDPMRRPHLVPGSPYAKDPASLHGPMTALRPGARLASQSGAATPARSSAEPLRLHYAGLDREASYKVRIVYTGDMFQVQMRPDGRRIDRGPPVAGSSRAT